MRGERRGRHRIQFIAAASLALACAAEAPADSPPAVRGAGGGSGKPVGIDASTAEATPAKPGAVTPAKPDAGTAGSSPGALVISEIMYHPVLEEAEFDNHEFVEIANRGTTPVSLTGWRLDGLVKFAFPAGTTLAGGGYLVVAKNRAALSAVTAYDLAPSMIVGEYLGELDNGGGAVNLLDAVGTAVDAVKYDDKFPWPIAADALGAGEDWLPKNLLPLKKHRFMGRSLERVSLDVSAAERANWEPSALDGATPGRANSTAGTPKPIVEALSATVAGRSDSIVRAQDAVVVQVSFSKFAPVKNVMLEWFVDDVARSDEASEKLAMTADENGVFRASLPPRPDNSILRYRIWADRGGGSEILSPRPSDPFSHHAAFVTPEVKTRSRTYHLFISPAGWSQIFDFVTPGRSSGCMVNPSWQATVPAVFVFEGKVFDVRVRYEGSRANRMKGLTIANWPFPGPTNQKPLKALSWRIKFPKYRDFEGRKQIALNKLNMACPGVGWHLETRLLEAAGVPEYRIGYARLHINGGYYHYMMEPEDIDEPMFARSLATGEAMGEIYKADGFISDEANQAWGDGRVIKALCGFTAEQRYAVTFKRVNQTFKDHAVWMKLIEELNAARAAGGPAIRDYFTRYFDIDKMLAGFAVRNWAGSWDDTVHNYFPYQRASDGKWFFVHQDFDQDFGFFSNKPATLSLYAGREGDPANALYFLYFKDAMLKAFKTEFDDKLKELVKTVLQPDNVDKVIDEGLANFSLDDWNQSPSDKACNVPASVNRIRAWAKDRAAVIMQRLP